MKLRILSYFAQLTSIVSCFQKYHSKVFMKRFRFFQIEESSKIAILPGLCIFFLLVKINVTLSINAVSIQDSACLGVSKALI